jgi:hypothetical protein
MALIAACSVKRPEGVIDEARLERILYDYHLAKALGENIPTAENYRKALYVEEVFRKHGTTEAVFDSSLVWYARNTELLSKIYERLDKRYKAQRDEINHIVAARTRKPPMSQRGDSIDVWAWRKLLRLTTAPADNLYTFVFPTDSNFKARDTIVWTARYRFGGAPADTLNRAVMALQIVYLNDSILSRALTVAADGVQQICLAGDTLGKLREVKGFIFFTHTRSATAPLIVDSLTLMRYHSRDTLSAAARDSVNRIHEARKDSINTARTQLKRDSASSETRQRLSPEEMNRRREGMQSPKKPEQIEVEERIREEQRERQRQQRLNQQRRQRGNAPTNRTR